MKTIRKIYKSLLMFALGVSYLLISSVAYVLIRNRNMRLTFLSNNASFFAKLSLIVLSIRVHGKNLSGLTDKNFKCLVVSNHLSYTDIFVIYSVAPLLFIANSELKDEFPLGIVTKNSGSLFIERRNRAQLVKDIEAITDVLKAGYKAVLFPEGTTSDGTALLDFKTPFFIPAIKSGADVLPVCIRYTKLDGAKIDQGNKDIVYFHEDVSFFSHFFRLVETVSIEVELTGLEVIKASKAADRKQLSKEAYRKISDAFWAAD